MLTLHYSNRLEELIEPLAEQLAGERARDRFEPGVIVIPNRAYAQFLKLRLAETSGIAANLYFPFLRRYLAELAAAADPALHVLEADELQLRLFEWLRGALGREPALQPLAAYAATAADNERELARFQLSARLARLLREYSTSRPAMMRRWRHGEALPQIDRTVQDWQRAICRALFDDAGCLRENGAARAMFLPDALAAIDDRRLAAVLPRNLHLFGLAYAAPEFVRIFARLGRLTELHLYCLNPCLEFWEDVPAGMFSTSDQRLVSRQTRLAPGALESEDPFEIDAAENPALVLWSRPGREYLRLLNEVTEGDFQPHFRPPILDDRAHGLLPRLQQAILRRQRTLPPPSLAPADDLSLRLFACPDVRGEVESIANAIWSLLSQGDFQPPLRFHEIGILLPDHALASYFPQFQAVFAELHAIPLHIADPVGRADPMVEAIELLLRLPLGSFGRDEVLHLLTHPALAGAEAINSAELQGWCEALGIYLGADERDLAGTYIPPTSYHWDQGLRRLTLGAFLTGTTRGEEKAFHAGDQGAFAPLAIEQDQIESAANLIGRARGLLAAASEMRRARLPLRQWGQVLRRMLASFLTSSEPQSARTLAASLSAIATMAAAQPEGEPAGYPTACEMALQALTQVQAETGNFAQSGVVLGSMSALRSLPFRILFVAAMGEGRFPTRENADPFDLRIARRQVGDVSPNQRDRYLFLEALLAARERLIISYVAREQVTGVALQPSALVSELGFVLGEELGEQGLAAITIEHPTTNYDRAYFPDLGGTGVRESSSHNFAAHRAARLAALRDHLRAHCGGQLNAPLTELLDAMAPRVRAKMQEMLEISLRQGPGVAPGDGSITLPLSALRRFLFCPLQGTARYRLGMNDDEDDRDGEDAADEPLEAPFLNRLMLLRNAFWEGRGQAQAVVDRFSRDLEHQYLEGQTPAGPFLEALKAQSQARLEQFSAQAETLGLGEMVRWHRIRFGAGEEFEEADIILPAIELEVPVNGKPVKVGLRGTLRVSAKLDRSYSALAGKTLRPKDFVEGALGAIALAAAGQAVAQRFSIVAIGFEEGKKAVSARREIAVPKPGAAREYLGTLIHDLLFGDEHYFFPIEAVAKILGDNSQDPARAIELVEQVRQSDGSRSKISSDYGPLRRARESPPPPADAIAGLIQRRFGPLRAIFEGQEDDQ
jgi:exodeoxyribonuclease V gamma subunit